MGEEHLPHPALDERTAPSFPVDPPAANPSARGQGGIDPFRPQAEGGLRTLRRLTPCIAFARSISATTSGTSAGRSFVTVWPSAAAIRYPSPAEPVAGQVAPPVARIRPGRRALRFGPDPFDAAVPDGEAGHANPGLQNDTMIRQVAPGGLSRRPPHSSEAGKISGRPARPWSERRNARGCRSAPPETSGGRRREGTGRFGPNMEMNSSISARSSGCSGPSR